jgi:hypothetical protein
MMAACDTLVIVCPKTQVEQLFRTKIPSQNLRRQVRSHAALFYYNNNKGCIEKKLTKSPFPSSK